MIPAVRCDDPDALAEAFRQLLDEEQSEQIYQSFLEENTFLLPREFVQNHGIHFSMVFRKLPFGADMVSDFVYLSKSTVRWNCVLIEIEKPGSKFFRANSQSFHPDFEKALQQINDWRAWFDLPSNKESFLTNTLGTIRTPLGRNPTDMKYVLVHGRRSEIENNPQRLAKVNALQRDDFRIMSFDSLCEYLQSKDALYIAVKRRDFVEIRSTVVADDSMFGWTEPEMIRLNPELRAKLEALRGRSNDRRFINGKMVFALDHYLDSTAASQPADDAQGATATAPTRR